jgi:steroid delta-isomerase-like uncharacterized protein
MDATEVVNEFYKALSAKQTKVAAALIDPKAVLHTLRQDPKQQDGDAQKQFAEFASQLLGGFPDLQFTVEEVLAKDDLVADRTTLSGTHNGAFLGLPASKTAVSLTLVSMSRVADGRIVERWGAAGGWL